MSCIISGDGDHRFEPRTSTDISDLPLTIAGDDEPKIIVSAINVA